MSNTYFSNSKTANVNFARKRGDSFYYGFQVSVLDKDTLTKQPVDLSLYDVAKMKVRQYEYSPSLLEFTSTGDTNTIDISNSNVGIISISGAPLTLNVGHYLYDLELSSSASGITETVIAGKFIIENETTF